MYHLQTALNLKRTIKLPVSRDQIMLLMAAFNEVMLGLDVYLAHLTSGEIKPYEWIPIIFGPLAGAALIMAGAVAMKKRTLANMIATLVFVASIIVGVLGSYFHFVRASIPAEIVGRWFSIDMLVWAPPILGPIAFAGIALWGLSAAWSENPPDSGRLMLIRNRTMQLPYSKTRGYFLLLMLGILSALVSSAFDHARTGFSNVWLWLPLAASIFALVVTAYLAFSDEPNRADLLTYLAAMLVLIIVGTVGAALHIQTDLTADSTIVIERFLRGAPLMAPLQFANLGLLGVIILLDPSE